MKTVQRTGNICRTKCVFYLSILVTFLKTVLLDKKLLEEKIKASILKTAREIEGLKEATKPISPENSIGRVSRMDAINNKSVAEASLRSTSRKLNNLQTALSKLSDPDFGICTRCKRPIQEARIMYMPESTRCVHCASK